MQAKQRVMSHRSLKGTGHSLWMTAALASTAAAQPASPPGAVLEEILVTAQRREQRLQDVPISMTAYDASRIAELSIQNVGEVLDYAPNVMRASGPSSADDGFFFFRGVGQVDVSANVDPGVGVYIDDVYLGRIQGASFDVLDVERIEILRGPQGTLFGRNTIGGAVSVTTRTPGDEFALEGRVVAGSRSRMDAYLSADLPITTNAAAMVSVYSRNQDGWGRDEGTGQTYGDREDIGVRAKLVWNAGERLDVSLGADHSRGRGSPLPSVLLGVSPVFLPLGPGGMPVPIAASPLLIPFPADLAGDIAADPFDGRIGTSIPPQNDLKRGGVNLTLDWNAGPVSVRSITAYREARQDVHADLDGSSYNFYDFLFGTDQDQFSQELQLSGQAADNRLQWLIGGYYFEESVLDNTGVCVGSGTAFPTGAPIAGMIPAAGPAVRRDGRCMRFDSNLFLDVESWAAFGQLEWALSDRLTATLGFRYTDESKTNAFDNSSDNSDGVFTVTMFDPDGPGPRQPAAGCSHPSFTMACGGNGPVIFTVSPRAGSQSQILGSPDSFRDTWSNFSPRLGLTYQWTDSTMTYLSWSKGFKSGGVQGRATPGNPIDAFEPEKIETLEIGAKTEWLDRRVRLNVAAFISDYKDIQLLVTEIVDGTPQFNTRNAGSSDISGIEMELLGRPVEELELSLGVGWLRNKYSELAPGAAAQGISLTDSLPNAPRWTLSLGAQYLLTLANANTMRLGADWSYRSEHSFQAAMAPGDVQGGYGLVNLRTTWSSQSQRLNVSLFARNVFDKDHFLTLNDTRSSLGVATGVPAPGREWGVELGTRF